MNMCNRTRERHIQKINDLEPILVSEVTRAINYKLRECKLDDYMIVWKQFQNIAVQTITTILENNFVGCKIILPKTKSVYPDIKLEVDGSIFAFDIKSNESQKEPWFDMARLDTLIAGRLNKHEEWELVIKYDSKTKKLIQIYFGLFREIVGRRNDCNGVKYRPYDGKLRPKSWSDFENRIIYWNSKEEFLHGIENSQKQRWKKLI